MPVFFGRPEPHPSKKHLYAILSRRNEHPPSGSLPCGILWFPHRSICVHPQKECTRMAKIRCGRAGCVQYFLAIRQDRREAAAPNRSPVAAVWVWKGGAREWAFCSAGIKRRRSKANFARVVRPKGLEPPTFRTGI